MSDDTPTGMTVRDVLKQIEEYVRDYGKWVLDLPVYSQGEDYPIEAIAMVDGDEGTYIEVVG